MSRAGRAVDASVHLAPRVAAYGVGRYVGGEAVASRRNRPAVQLQRVGGEAYAVRVQVARLNEILECQYLAAAVYADECGGARIRADGYGQRGAAARHVDGTVEDDSHPYGFVEFVCVVGVWRVYDDDARREAQMGDFGRRGRRSKNRLIRLIGERRRQRERRRVAGRAAADGPGERVAPHAHAVRVVVVGADGVLYPQLRVVVAVGIVVSPRGRLNVAALEGKRQGRVAAQSHRLAERGERADILAFDVAARRPRERRPVAGGVGRARANGVVAARNVARDAPKLERGHPRLLTVHLVSGDVGLGDVENRPGDSLEIPPENANCLYARDRAAECEVRHLASYRSDYGRAGRGGQRGAPRNQPEVRAGV